MRIFLSSPDVGRTEREYLLRAFDSGWIAPAGPDLTAFEDDVVARVGWPGAVALSSGTAALHLALLAVGVSPGSTVLCSTFTFAASVNAIAYCGASPVFIDSEAESWNMSPELLERELEHSARRGSLPAAVVVVDLYGQPADFDPISELCQRFGVPIVEDAAEAMGSTYKGRAAGTLGDVGVYSFNGNKIMTTSGGGMLLTPDLAVARHARHLSTQARMPVSHYEHEEVGYNYRLSNLLAALGRAQVSRLDSMIARRRAINDAYRALLADIEELAFMPIPVWSGWNGWLTCAVFADPAVSPRVQNGLQGIGIECRPLWKPMHRQPAYSTYRAVLNGVSDRLFDIGLCLPSGSALSDDQVEETAGAVRSWVRKARRS